MFWGGGAGGGLGESLGCWGGPGGSCAAGGVTSLSAAAGGGLCPHESVGTAWKDRKKRGVGGGHRGGLCSPLSPPIAPPSPRLPPPEAEAGPGGCQHEADAFAALPGLRQRRREPVRRPWGGPIPGGRTLGLGVRRGPRGHLVSVPPPRKTDQWPQKLIMQLIPQQLLVRGGAVRGLAGESLPAPALAPAQFHFGVSQFKLGLSQFVSGGL